MAPQTPPTNGPPWETPLRQRHICDNRNPPHVTPDRTHPRGRWSVVPSVAHSRESEYGGKVADVDTRELNDSGSGESTEKVESSLAHRCTLLNQMQTFCGHITERQQPPGGIHPVGTLLQIMYGWSRKERPLIFFFFSSLGANHIRAPL